MLLTASGHRHQRGQALLLVLVFLAAFLLLIWAALRLASGAFLRQASVQTDTRETYALDAGLAYGLQYVRVAGPLCGPFNPPAFTLNYPTGNVTVTVNMTAPATCTAANPVSDIKVTAVPDIPGAFKVPGKAVGIMKMLISEKRSPNPIEVKRRTDEFDRIDLPGEPPEPFFR